MEMNSKLEKYIYPAYFVSHPNIGHQDMVQKIFPYLKPEIMDFNKYLRYYQICYLILCQNFNEYEEYLIEEHWKEFKNKRRIKYESK